MVFVENILFLYPNVLQRVKLHQDKDTSNTSETITAFIKKKTDTDSIYRTFQYISANFPDISPTDYCEFGLLK